MGAEKRPATEVVQAPEPPQETVTLVGSQEGGAAGADGGNASPEKGSPTPPDHSPEQAVLQSPKVEGAVESPAGNGSPLAVAENGTPKEVCMDAADSPKGEVSEPPKLAPQSPQQADSPARRTKNERACCRPHFRGVPVVATVGQASACRF